MNEEKARELLAAEYQKAGFTKLADLVLSGAHLNEDGIHAASIRALRKALEEGALQERERVVEWVGRHQSRQTAKAIERGDHLRRDG